MRTNEGYIPNEMECEKASNGYLMSLVAVIAGLPLPIINLLATLFFYLGNRKSTWFVRWHCTQTLLSQLTVLVMNSVGFSWTVAVVLGDSAPTNKYIGYMLTIILFNAAEFIVAIYAAVRVRKGEHVQLWFWGELTDMICKPPATQMQPQQLNPENNY